MKRENKGSITILVASITCLMLGLIPGLVGVGSFLTARAQAQTAADAASLAAIQELLSGGDVGQAASQYAGLNGGSVTNIETGDGYVVVYSEVDVNLPFLDHLSSVPHSVGAKSKAELKDGIIDVL